MKNKLLLSMVVIFCIHTKLYANDTLQATTEVRYIAKCTKDTVKNLLCTDTLCLCLAGNKTLFYNPEKYRTDSLRYYDAEAYHQEMASKIIKSRKQSAKAKSEYYILTNHKDSTYIYEDKISAYTYQYNEKIPNFNWKIEHVFHTIAGHLCQKATCSYMGRTYVAWYATDIPLAVGPWKFAGLPGLIVEVADTKKQYSFHFIDMRPCNKNILLLPKKKMKTNLISFLIEQEKYIKDPFNYLSKTSGINIIIKGHDKKTEKNLIKDTRYRPMEIVEQ